MLSLRGIAKRYADVVALDDLTLEIDRGEVFGLLGPNGAGKTTTVGITTGLVRPDKGRVDIDGAGAPTDPAVRARVGVAPQSLSIYDELTARENLLFFGRIYALGRDRLHKRVDELLDWTGLADRAGSRAGTYSGGMKRRLNLAAALLHDPPLLLLDEPTAGVDPQSRNNLFEVVQRLAGEGKTVIYTTHYMEEAQRLCDRVGIIDHGRLLALDTVSNLIETHAGPSTIHIEIDGAEERIESSSPADDLPRILSDRAGTPIRSLRVERPTLESVFLHLTGRSLRD
jgi:ABC-2 type transport system ATP-binding protein